VPGEGGNDAQNPQRNQCIGISRGGRNTKIHAIVDALGNPVHVQLSAGNVHDSKVAADMLSHVHLAGTTVLADKAYGTWKLREYITDHDADFCIPPKANEADPWFCDWWLYKERHLVENFFQKLKEFRRVASRYDKLAHRFLGFVHLACIRILLA
jgi:transposase